MVLGLFKSKEEKEKEHEEKNQQLAARISRLEAEISRVEQEKAYDLALAQVKFTPESKDEYERRVGYAVEVIDTGDRNIGILFRKEKSEADYSLVSDFELKKRLVKAGIEAIVGTNFSHAGNNYYWYHNYYGLPVCRKNGGPYR